MIYYSFKELQCVDFIQNSLTVPFQTAKVFLLSGRASLWRGSWFISPRGQWGPGSGRVPALLVLSAAIWPWHALDSHLQGPGKPWVLLQLLGGKGKVKPCLTNLVTFCAEMTVPGDSSAGVSLSELPSGFGWAGRAGPKPDWRTGFRVWVVSGTSLVLGVVLAPVPEAHYSPQYICRWGDVAGTPEGCAGIQRGL